MNEEYKLLLSFLGYGDPKNSIWFIGNEEHGNINDIAEWNEYIRRINMCDNLFSVTVDNDTYNVRKDLFNGDLNYIGYRRCARILENYYKVTNKESVNMLGRERSFFTNIFPIPYIIEGGEQEWFYERTGINHNDYIRHAFNIRTKIFCEAISLYKPKALIIFASTMKDAFVKEIHKQFFNGAFIDETSRSWILPPIINPYHPGQNMTRVTEDDWVKGISDYLAMISKS